MTKTILLTAASVAILGFAGAASAQEISGAEVSNIALNVTDTPTIYTIASEVQTAVANNRRTTTALGENVVSFGPSDSEGNSEALLASDATTTFQVVYTLAGSATPTFIAGVAADRVTFTGTGCTTISEGVVTGGTAGGNSYTFRFTVPSGCTQPVVNVDIPYQVARAGNVTATVTTSISSTNTNPSADPTTFVGTDTVQLVQAASGYRTFVSGLVDNEDADGDDNADFRTTLALGESGDEPFTGFSEGGDNIIGALGVSITDAPASAVNATIYGNLRSAPLPGVTYDVTITATNGDFNTLSPSLNSGEGSGTPTTGGFGQDDEGGDIENVFVFEDVTGDVSVFLNDGGEGAETITLTPLTYTASIEATLADDENGVIDADLVSTSGSGSLETVGLEGTSFFAPWVQSGGSAYNSVIRISNSNAEDTGAVQLQLTSPLNGPTKTLCTSDDMAKLSTVSANGELAINSNDLTTCFGNFGRGDVTVTILSNLDGLAAKLRIVNPGNVVTEQSLGRLAIEVTNPNGIVSN